MALYEQEIARLHFILHTLSLDMLNKEENYNKRFAAGERFCGCPSWSVHVCVDE